MRLSFAYGSNMDPEQMARRCVSAVLDGVAELPAHRFVVTRDGYGSVAPEPAGTVHGVVWRLAEADERALDEYEGVPEGLYRKEVKLVYPPRHGTPVEVLIYVACEGAPGTPRPGYMETVVGAARRHGFPAAYVGELARWLVPEGPETGPGSSRRVG